MFYQEFRLSYVPNMTLNITWLQKKRMLFRITIQFMRNLFSIPRRP